MSRTKITEAQAHERLLADGRGITLVSYSGFSKRPSTFRCPQGHEWQTTLNSVTGSMQSGCAVCAGAVPVTEAAARERLAADGRGITLVSYGGTMLRKSTFRCLNGCEWQTVLHSIVGPMHTGCPMCVVRGGGFKPAKAATLYLLVGLRDGRINVGITGDFERRVAEHAYDDSQQYAVVRKVDFDTGYDARAAEVLILEALRLQGHRPIAGCLEEFALPVAVVREVFDAVV
jgi:hypothetical protein